jgi:hypothetical protein
LNATASTTSVAPVEILLVAPNAEAATSLAASETVATAPSNLETWETGPSRPEIRQRDKSVARLEPNFGSFGSHAHQLPDGGFLRPDEEPGPASGFALATAFALGCAGTACGWS